jgi:hypothetical protein
MIVELNAEYPGFSLGDGGWLKTLRLEDYAPRRLRPVSLQLALFPYHEAWG